MKRVLILTASYGDGHNAAAHNLCAALEAVDPSSRVAVIDPLQDSCGALDTAAHKAYHGIVRFAPMLWSGLYSVLDSTPGPEKHFVKMHRLQAALGNLLQDAQPDCVVSTHPLYGNIIQQLYRDHAQKPFPLITIVIDSIGVNSAWLQTPSDLYCVTNPAAVKRLEEAGVPATKIKRTGFPVDPMFCQPPTPELRAPGKDEPRRILFLVNSGKKKLGKAIKKLLAVPEFHLTIAVGRDPHLKAKLLHNLSGYGDRVQVLGWTNMMPQLLMSHHLVIGKAGGALVQEAIAARCPMIASQVTAGEEEASAVLLEQNDIGIVAEKIGPMVDWAVHAFKHDCRLWSRWRANLERISQPREGLSIAKLVLEQCEGREGVALQRNGTSSKHAEARCSSHDQTREIGSVVDAGEERNGRPATRRAIEVQNKPLLCDFHIHSNYSDGKLSVAEVIDFYGSRHFDCICITDHLADPRRLIGKLGKLARLTLSPHQMQEYFEVVDRERRRAWRKYGMLVMTGIEFNKDGLTKKSSAHLLGVDLKRPIPDNMDIEETVELIHAQQGLAIASHPHIMKSEWGKNTLYLWENQERFASTLDAWEVANRNNMFNPVSSKRLPYVANSDFHKPKHIYSWKTLLHCSKTPEAIKDCIRRNEHVAITLYRESLPAVTPDIITTGAACEPEASGSSADLSARAAARTLLLPAA